MEQMLIKRDPVDVQAFIDAGTDLNVKDTRGNTALMWASSKGQTEMVKQLIQKGADINLQNNRSETALMFASKNNHMDIVRMLLDAGADPNIRDRDGYTASNKYALNEKINTLLKERGAKVNPFLSAIDDKNQTEFMNSLSDQEKTFLLSYIAYGVPLINGVLQENLHTNPLGVANVTGKFIETHGRDATGKIGTIRKFLTDFLNVVKRAPVLKEELMVYRGITSKNDLPDGNAFLSTTTQEYITRNYKGEDCCLLKMHLKPGVRVVYIEPLRARAYDRMKLRTASNLWEILVVPPYNVQIVDEGGGNYTVTLTPKAPYVRRAGTRRRRKNKRRTSRR